MKHQNKHFIAILVLITISVPTFLLFSNKKDATAITYSPFCTSSACRAAADAEAAAQAKADAASAAANDLQGKIDSLNAEIEAIQAQINANQAIADELSEKITKNEEKLSAQQTALADLLVKMHFDSTPNTIMILASSGSIGDFAEKQSRQETVKSQITQSAIEIKKLKEQLDQQKAGIDAIIESQSAKHSEIADRRNEQSTLMAKYKYDASAYTKEAQEAAAIKAREISNAIQNSNNIGDVSYDGNGNSYPYRDICPGYTETAIARGDGAYGGYKCQCTSYAGWKVYETYGILISGWGNANNWGNSAVANGYREDGEPEPGAVAYSTAGGYGHVMWVESVNGGTITLSEYNWSYGDFTRRYNVPASWYRYIHFN